MCLRARCLGLPRWLFAAHVAWAGGGVCWLALLGLWPGLLPPRFFCVPVWLSSVGVLCCAVCSRALHLRSSRAWSVSAFGSGVCFWFFWAGKLWSSQLRPVPQSFAEKKSLSCGSRCSISRFNFSRHGVYVFGRVSRFYNTPVWVSRFYRSLCYVVCVHGLLSWK